MPEDNDNPPVDRDEFLATCDATIGLLDEELDDDTYQKAPAFFDNVRETVGSMRTKIRGFQTPTTKMLRAVLNMKGGVERWISRGQ